ncbi:uncharacterized protein DUF983 [Lacibacter cauensis]|uniref:Uncharacterized protein DUF983 n=1 Tax=Lacibacter cauensis TaxID=510947 RepID=A0A562SS70_9BACT|nr:DUF983 domain-containing protein [Lacibacter cauensis]TWI83666.1 uncharacterized protein DUF983 [Lacibacter cauensis]
MGSSNKPKPNYLWSMLSMNCPRCRRGKLFKPFSAYNFKHTFDMHEECSVCKQKFDMEPGFWYGTGYVSYALTVAISVATFVAWWVLIGVSFDDNRVFWWLGLNAVLLLILQPWLMRLSRTIYLYFFVRYDEDYETSEPQKFDY